MALFKHAKHSSLYNWSVFTILKPQSLCSVPLYCFSKPPVAHSIYQHARSPSIPHEQQLYCCIKCLKSLYLSHSRDRKYHLRAARGHLYVLTLPPDILIHIACLSVVHTVILVFYKLREIIWYTLFSFQPAGSYLFICKQYSVALVELNGA